MGSSQRDVRGTLLRCFLKTLREFDIAGRVRRVLGDRRRGRVLAVGKAASAMLAGAWDASVERALLVVPTGTRVAWAGARIEVRYATHPDPTRASVEAAEAAMAFAGEGLDLALVSGGASSLLALPIEGLSLDRKVEVVQSLSNAGVPIRVLNLVRRHLSRIKGGGLARASHGPLATLVVSDVLEGGAHDIGSGPTVPDPTTEEEARRVLAAHGLVAPTCETLKPEDERARATSVTFVATPADLASLAASALESEGFDVHLLPPTDADADDIAQAYAGLSKALVSGQALVRAAEPSIRVTVDKPGRGGRSTHLAALAGPMLAEGVTLLCGATDGVDGTSASAGAVVDAQSLRSHDVGGALARFDTARVHRAAGTLIELPSSTGLNFCDLHILAKA